MDFAKLRQDHGSERASYSLTVTYKIKYATAPSPAELKGLVEGAVSLLPDDTKAAYLEACAKAPVVVAEESPPAQFLRHGEADGCTAALRLCSYWQRRKNLFGVRAFLQMKAINGALSSQDVAILKSGLFSLTHDAEGNDVWLVDHRPIDGTASLKEAQLSKIRTIWYLLTQSVKRNCPVTSLRFSKDSRWSRGQAMTALELYEDFPLPSYRMLYVCLPDNPAKFEKRARPVLEEVCRSQPSGRCAYFVGDSPSSLAQQLVPGGLPADKLPDVLGGTWVNDFDQWLAKILSHESPPSPVQGTNKAARDPKRLPAKKRKAELVLSSHETSSDTTSVAPQGDTKLAPETNRSIVDLRRVHKRKMDVAYARERRRREKQEWEELQMNHAVIYERNLELREEEARLTKLLRQAIDQVELHVKPTAGLSRPAAINCKPLAYPQETVASSLLVAPAHVMQGIGKTPNQAAAFSLPGAAGRHDFARGGRLQGSSTILLGQTALQASSQTQVSQPQTSLSTLMGFVEGTVATMNRRSHVDQLLLRTLGTSKIRWRETTLDGVLSPLFSNGSVRPDTASELAQLLMAPPQLPPARQAPATFPSQPLDQLILQAYAQNCRTASQTPLLDLLLESSDDSPTKAALKQALLNAIAKLSG